MATISTSSSNNLSGLAKRLVADGLIDADSAQTALQDSYKQKIPFVTYLVQSKKIKAIDIASAASDEFGVPLMDLAARVRVR